MASEKEIKLSTENSILRQELRDKDEIIAKLEKKLKNKKDTGAKKTTKKTAKKK